MNQARREVGIIEPAASLFRTYFERFPEPVYVFSLAGDRPCLLVANEAGLARTNLHDPAGLGLEELFGDAFEVVDQVRACLESAEIRHCEIEVREGDAEPRRVALTFVPADAAHVVVHERDITQQRRWREALVASEQHARTPIRSNPEILIRMTGDGKYLEFQASPEARAFLAVEPEQCLGQYVDELYEPAFARQHACYRRKVLEESSVQFWQYACGTSEGSVDLEARFVRCGEDEVLITVRDIGKYVERDREAVLSVERERNRIGQDLHDGLAQLLTGANLLLEPIKDRVGPELGAQRDNLHRAVDLIKQSIAQTRELARGLSPVPRGGGFNLGAALAELAQQSQDYFGLSCYCDCRAPLPELSAETATNLYRIAQEALTNAVKHGGARHVDLTCSVDADRLELTIADDGCGIGLDEAHSAHSGMGLNIMRFRACAIGAELAIGPGEESGTVVKCTVAGPRGRHGPKHPDGGGR